LPLTLSVSVLNGALVGFVLLSAVSETRILIWTGLVVGLSALRLALWYTYRRTDVELCRTQWGTYLPACGALASGILWGSSAFLFSPLDESHLLFLTLVIAGMCAGAATVHAAHFPSVVAFILPAIVPLAVTFLMQGSRLQIVSGVMAGVFGVSLCLVSLKFRRWFRETTAARLISVRQKSRISKANELLRAEIADHRFTEAKLQHALKLEAIGLLTAGVAHDFNNILFAIGGSAELIASRRGSDLALAPQIKTISQAVQRAATLTQQLLAVGRKQSLMPRIADINEVLHGMQELLIATLGGHGGIELQLTDTPAIAFVDTAQLQNAVLNLVINARDAMTNGGSVTIKTAILDGHDPDTVTGGLVGSLVVISVSDTGTGMSEDVRLRAFDPFFTTKRTGTGSGLGLSQVYGLVKQSGGEARIDSRIGQGTTVSIYLPSVAMGSMPAQATQELPSYHVRESAAPKLPRNGRRVLVLDDDDEVLETVTGILSESGYTVVPFGTAREALEEVNGPEPIDLMVVDFAMPDMRGDQFALKARLRRPAIPILFISGYAEPSSLLLEPFVLKKPFSVASLISITEEAMQIVA
jgi:signal transduction histidine kinase